jgi:membrane-associated phospholipid phosphatase
VAASVLAVSLWLVAPKASAQCAAPWQRLRENGNELIRPESLMVVSSAALTALLMSPTDADYELRVLARRDLGGSYDPEPVSLIAPYAAAAGAVASWGIAALADGCEWQKAPTAMIQGMAWTLGAVGLTKLITGRGFPNAGRDPNAPDALDHPQDAQRFRLFGGLDTAFPSGHTAVMFAAAAALRASSPELGGWRYLGYPFAVGVGFGMWWGEHHWASDVIAGALLGEALGASAGRAWSAEARSSSGNAMPEGAWVLLPMQDGGLLSYAGVF